MSWADLDPAVNQYMSLSTFPKIQLFTSICPGSHSVPSSAQSYQDYVEQFSHTSITPLLAMCIFIVYRYYITVYTINAVVEDINIKKYVNSHILSLINYSVFFCPHIRPAKRPALHVTQIGLVEKCGHGLWIDFADKFCR